MCPFTLVKIFVVLSLSVFSQGHSGRPNNAASHPVACSGPRWLRDQGWERGLRDFSTGRARCEVSLLPVPFLPAAPSLHLWSSGRLPSLCRNAACGLGSFPRRQQPPSAVSVARQQPVSSIRQAQGLSRAGSYSADPRGSHACGHTSERCFICFQICALSCHPSSM